MARKKKTTAIEESHVDTQEEQPLLDETIPTTEDETTPTSEYKEPATEDKEPTSSKTEHQMDDREHGQPEEDTVVNSWSDVNTVLELDTSFTNKIEILSKCGFKPVEILAAFYKDYLNGMTPKVQSDVGAKYNTRLYNNLLKAIRTDDPEIFKTKFDIINMFFILGADGAFNEFRLTRFSDIQKLSTAQLDTYHRLTVLISTLADAATREKNSKAVGGFNADNTVLTDDDVSRLRKYYGM